MADLYRLNFDDGTARSFIPVTPAEFDAIARAEGYVRAASLLSDARRALEAASVIGERHGTPLNYGNHDRLIREINRVLGKES